MKNQNITSQLMKRMTMKIRVSSAPKLPVGFGSHL
uniref:Uncharacterized protein n=1 Tax=Arundo donax TaxID=35708 RepID=A0A0A8YQY4_ARUDO